MLGFKKHSINNISGMTTVNCHQIYFYHVTNFINVEFKVSTSVISAGIAKPESHDRIL